VPTLLVGRYLVCPEGRSAIHGHAMKRGNVLAVGRADGRRQVLSQPGIAPAEGARRSANGAGCTRERIARALKVARFSHRAVPLDQGRELSR